MAFPKNAAAQCPMSEAPTPVADKDGKLIVINVSDSVYDVFDITGMDDIMDIRRAEPEKGAVSDDPLNDTTWPLTFTPVTALFEEQVAAHPDRLAVVSTGVSMTYAELNEAANRIANTLRYYNVRPDDTVMVPSASFL